MIVGTYLGDVEPLIPHLQPWIDASQKHQILHQREREREHKLLLVAA